MLSLAMRDRLVLVAEGLDGEHRPERLVLHDGHRRRRSRRAPSAGSRSRRPAPGRRAARRRSAASAPSAMPALRRTPRPCRGARRRSAGRSRPRRRTGRRAGSARPGATSSSTNSSWIDSSTTSRAPAEQTWPECRNTAVSAKSSAASRSASAKTMLGFLPPSSRATFFTVAGGGGHDPLAGLEPAGERDQVDAGVLAERGAGARARRRAPGWPTPGGQPGLLEQAHQQDRGVRGELAGLEHEGVAGGQAGRDLPRRSAAAGSSTA